METTQLSRAELLELVRELRQWADCYEDHMGSDEFARRDEALRRADAVLLAESGRI